MKNHTEKKPRGRPVKPESTALIDALIGRQDQMARRTAGKIEQIYKDHVSLVGADYLVAKMGREARERFGRLPDEFLARRSSVEHPEVAREVLRDLIAEVLTEWPDPAWAELEAYQDLEEPRPAAVTRSHSLADARAQAARLQTAHMQLKARCRSLPANWPHRSTAAPTEET
ncbi:MAG: hypothetical protein Q7W02_00080 [Candidatus Rokubacteria bacterium]|nr:hypothetical protein [Candidatus Rokubacteria bacterium]